MTPPLYYPEDEFKPWREYTVLRLVNGRWEPVGLTGSLDRVKGEMADWRRDCPDDVFAFGQRDVGAWNLGDEK